MSKPLLATVFSHWHKPYEGLQSSAMEFYSSVEAAVGRRQIPDVTLSRIEFHEGGAGSAKRQYLRIARKKLTFDVCAAPFGTGYFFSWWLGEKKPSRWLMLVFFLQIILAAGFTQAVARSLQMHLYRAHGFVALLRLLTALHGFPLWLILFLLLGAGLRPILRSANLEPEDPILATPIVGTIYQLLFSPETYYKIDTILMYQAQVKGAVEEAVDGLTTSKGLRALTEDEKKPILREFLRK